MGLIKQSTGFADAKLYALLTAFCLTILTSCYQSEVIINSLRELNIKDNVKSIKETEYEAVDKIGQIEKGKEYFTKHYVFDENGNKTEESEYWHDELREKTLFYYGEQERLRETRRVFGLSQANIMDTEYHELNEVLNYDYRTNSDGKIFQSLVRAGSYEATRFGLLGDSTIYLYDSNGDLLERRAYKSKQTYYGNGEEVDVPDVYVSKYDKNGRLQISFSGSEVYQEVINEEYQKYLKKPRGKYILSSGFFGGAKLGSLIRFDTGMSHRHKYLYEDKLLLADILTFKNEGSKIGGQYYIRSDYNKFGDIISESTSTSDITVKTPIGYDPNKIITYSYAYDEHGNWVTKIKYSNGIVRSVFERIYKYY